MATILNDPQITTSYGNTGLPGKAVNPQAVKGFILLDKSKFIPAASLTTAATCIAYIQAQTLLTGKARYYPVMNVASIVDGSTEPTFEKLGNDAEVFVKEGKNIYTYRLNKGGLELNKQLRTFNLSEDFSALLIDSGNPNTIFGMKNAAGNLYGYSLDQIFTFAYKANDYAKTVEYRTKLAFTNVGEMNDSFGYVRLANALENQVKGILPVDLTSVSKLGTTTVVWKIRAVEVATQTSLGEAFSSALAAPAAWAVTKAGAPVTVASVAYVPESTLGAKDDTFDLSIGSSPTGVHVANLVTPTALAALHVGEAPEGGFESTGSVSLSLG
jgi:hypothetical protein